ncbi:hypothetical protein OIV83_002741 [Microbotryomycetes sp. JL201]|nr:hypothetical protein OIV83_002741 [Microbotryomycetes sp. JL201]
MDCFEFTAELFVNDESFKRGAIKLPGANDLFHDIKNSNIFFHLMGNVEARATQVRAWIGAFHISVQLDKNDIVVCAATAVYVHESSARFGLVLAMLGWQWLEQQYQLDDVYFDDKQDDK